MRLPPFIEQLSPIAETLTALQTEHEALTAHIARRNAQVAVSTAEEGLSLWEADYALPSTGTLEERRRRIREVLRGRRTLTAQLLRELAEAYGADWGEVEEDFGGREVTLRPVFDGRFAEDISGLQALIERLSPAHLAVNVAAKEKWKLVLRRHGAITPPEIAGEEGGACANGEYAVFAGGMHPSQGTMYSTVNAYDTDLLHYIPGYLEKARFLLGAARAGEYAIFAGGCTSSTYSTGFVDTTDAYGDGLAHVNADTLLSARGWPVGASLGGSAIFAGGYRVNYMDTVERFDADLTHSMLTSLSQARREFVGCATDRHAFFAGGVPAYGSKTNTVDVYDESFTRKTATGMRASRSHLSAARAGGYVLFAGGYRTASSITNLVDAYDDALTRTAAPDMGNITLGAGGGSLGGYGLFVGGWNTMWNMNAVIIYDETLSRSVGESVSVEAKGYQSATVDNTAFFCITSHPVAEVFRLVEDKPET